MPSMDVMLKEIWWENNQWLLGTYNGKVSLYNIELQIYFNGGSVDYVVRQVWLYYFGNIPVDMQQMKGN